MKSFLLRFFTWWNGQTFGTQLWTWLYGERVGQDEFGNIYYRTKGGKIDPTLLFERRWVVYSGYRGSFDDPAVLAWLDASHRRRSADRRKIQAASVAEAAPAQHDRHARRLSPVGIDARTRPPPESDRRLQGLEAGAVSASRAAKVSRLKEIPRGVWALGFVSLLMDISSEMIHALLPLYLVTVLGASMRPSA